MGFSIILLRWLGDGVNIEDDVQDIKECILTLSLGRSSLGKGV
jgi:hypothetical protein